MLIYPYKPASKSAKALSELLGARRIKHNNSRFIGRARKTVINWGCSSLPPEVMKCNVINRPEAVSLCANKLRFFQHLADTDVAIPEWTQDMDIAREWTEGSTVVERHVLTGNSGAGIRLVDNPEEVQQAPLYTKYKPKKAEYRVHVFRGEVLLVQQKVKRADVPADEINWKIRNHDGGFIFQQNNIEVPDGIIEQSIAAVQHVGLDFGAVDIIYNKREDLSYVLEINTAPGLMGTTGERYAEAFRRV